MKFIQVTIGSIKTLLNVAEILSIQVEDRQMGCSLVVGGQYFRVDQNPAQVVAMINQVCVHGTEPGCWVTTMDDLPK